MAHAKIEQRICLLRRTELAQAITAFLIDRKAAGLSARTVEFYAGKLRQAQAYLERLGMVQVHDITADALRQFLVDLERAGHNSGGCHAFFRALKAWLRWCWQEYEIDRPCPIDKLHGPKVTQEPLEPVPLATVRAMLQTCDKSLTGARDKALLLALLDTGCRASEFLALNVQDVNLSTGAVLIRRGKGGKFRTAFLGHKARQALLRYLRHRPEAGPTEPLWATVAGGRLTYSGLREIVQRRARRADVEVPSLHSFRRAFALACLRAGMDVYSLQKLMGHADLSVLRRYLAQTEQDLQTAHQKAGPVDKLLA